MADITMCMNNLCDMKDDCLRYTAKPDENNQSWMFYICEGNEWFFVPNDKYNNKKR
jgi:hypothetical protein